MIRAYSLLVILVIVLSTFICIHFMSPFFSRGTCLVATEFHTPHTTWNGLITNHLVDWWGQGIWLKVGQLPIKAGWKMLPSHSVIQPKHLNTILYIWPLIFSRLISIQIYLEAVYNDLINRHCLWFFHIVIIEFSWLVSLLQC